MTCNNIFVPPKVLGYLTTHNSLDDDLGVLDLPMPFPGDVMKVTLEDSGMMPLTEFKIAFVL